MTKKKNKGLIFIEITKIDEEQRIVGGYATTDSLDIEGDIIDLDATREAVEEYRQWGNVRYMHQAHAVGVVKEMEVDDKGLYVEVKVVDDDCWVKVREGVLKGFSIGFRILECIWDGIKDAWRITKYLLIEISLVDRPANPDCIYDVIKRADDGDFPPEAAGKDVKTAVAGLLTKALAFLGFNNNSAKTPTQEANDMNEEETRKLVTEEVGKAKTEIVAELGGKLDEIKAALPAKEPEEPADPEPEPAEEPTGAEPEPKPEPAPEEPAEEPNLDEKVADIEKRLKGVEAGASRAAPGQDDPPEKNEKWSGVLDNVFLSLPRQ